jgi:outer membrane lipoprotein-sorting protein
MTWNEQHELEEADMLQTYWSELLEASGAEPPAGLDPEIAAVARHLTRAVPISEPDSAFIARLQERLVGTQVARLNGRAPRYERPWPLLRVLRPHRRLVLGLTLAAMIALALVIAMTTLTTIFWISPQPVSAQDIVRRALTAAASPTRLQSLVVTEEATLWPAQGYPNFGYAATDLVRSSLTRYLQGASHWRVVTTTSHLHSTSAQLSVLGPSGVSVSDGSSVWGYCEPCQTVQVQRYSGQDGPGALWPLGPTLGTGGATLQNLQALLSQLQECYRPRPLADATIAGRPAYVVALEPNGCMSASAAEEGGRRVLWVDRQTFLVLKSVLYSVYDPTKVFQEATVTRVQNNVAIPASLFRYTPPLGTRILDGQQTPAGPNVGAHGPELRGLAARVSFPIYVPSERLAGLALQRPQIGAPMELHLVYAPAGASVAAATSVTITERPASPAEEAIIPPHARPVLVAGPGATTLSGWYRAGAAGQSNRLMLIREGVTLTFSSGLLGRESLVALAGSLVRLSAAPTSTPTPAAGASSDSLSALRSRVPFPLVVPTYVPTGLRPLSPTLQGGLVQIDYQAPNGSIGLSVLEGAAGCCLDADPRKGGLVIALPQGVTAHLLAASSSATGGILWWERNGAFVAITGPDLTPAALERIAASMSESAPLGPVAAPRPTPTPTTPFRVLRPHYLPEPMDVNEQLQAAGPGANSVELVFTPRARNWNRSYQGMTLSETAQTAANNGALPDPEASRETIGGHHVLVIRRSFGGRPPACVSLSWTQRGVALRLDNAFQPGNYVRYTCAQLRAVVASVR